MQREFFYLVFNMLIIPGLAVPAGYNAWKMITENYENLELFLLNFYVIQSSNFYITLIIQQISIGFMSTMLNLGTLPQWGFSATYFLAFRKKTEFQHDYFTSIVTTFNYGYSLSVVLVMVCIFFVYS